MNQERKPGFQRREADSAGIGCLIVLRRHLPKRNFNNAGGVFSNSELPKQYAHIFMPPDKILIAFCRRIPAFVLDKRIVAS